MIVRLAEHDQGYDEAVVERDLRQDRDETLSMSDTGFDDQWLSKRRVLERELDIVISEADRMRSVCIEAELDIDAQQRLASDIDDISDENSHNENDPLFGLQLVADLPLAHEEIRGSPTDEAVGASTPGSSSARVNSWLENLVWLDE